MGGWLAMPQPASATLPPSVRRPASASPAIRGAGQLPLSERLAHTGLVGELAELRVEVALDRLAGGAAPEDRQDLSPLDVLEEEGEAAVHRRREDRDRDPAGRRPHPGRAAPLVHAGERAAHGRHAEDRCDQRLPGERATASSVIANANPNSYSMPTV